MEIEVEIDESERADKITTDKPKEKRKRKNGGPRFRLRRLAYQIVGLMVVLTLAATILGNSVTPDNYQRILDGIFILVAIFMAAAGVLIIASVRTIRNRSAHKNPVENGLFYFLGSPSYREWLEVGLICLLVAMTFLLMLAAMSPAIGTIFSNVITCPDFGSL